MTSTVVYTSDAANDAARAAEREVSRRERIAVLDAHAEVCDCRLDASQCDLGLS